MTIIQQQYCVNIMNVISIHGDCSAAAGDGDHFFAAGTAFRLTEFSCDG